MDTASQDGWVGYMHASLVKQVRSGRFARSRFDKKGIEEPEFGFT